MADEGTEHPNAKYGSEIIHGDEKGKLLERGSKIHGAQANKIGRQPGTGRGYPTYSLTIAILYISKKVFRAKLPL